MTNSRSDLSIWPNPANDQFTITLKSEILNELVLHDISGRVVYQTLNRSDLPVTIDTKGLEAGTYFVTARSDNFKHTEKLIILK
jgi:hypothetical protein